MAENQQREKCRLAIARQLALTQGYVWQAHPSAQQSKKQYALMTYAESILATVERMQADFRWPKGSNDDGTTSKA